VAIAFDVAWPLLDTEQVVGRDLGCQALENQLAAAGDVEQRAARQHRKRFESLQLQAAVLRRRRRRLEHGDIVALQVDRHDVDRGPGPSSQRHDRVDLRVLIDRQPFGDQDQRLVAVDERQPGQEIAQRRARHLGVLAHPRHHLRGFVDDVALALTARIDVERLALASDDLGEHDLVALVGDGERL
jgi:hypothetical protein